MSTDEPIDLKQDRRQWLKTSATVLGAALLPLPAVAEAETVPATLQVKPGETRSAARFLSPAQHTLVEELSETEQAVEAAAVEGVEEAADHPERPVHTHEEYGRPDDVPPNKNAA